MHAATFFRSLSILHGAGVPWPQAVDQASGGEAKLRPAREALARGEGVTAAFAGVLDPLDVALLRAGEASGNLQAVLAEMATAHDEDGKRRSRRLAATLYPIVLAHIAAVLLPLPDLMARRTGAALLWALGVLVPLYAVLYLGRRLDRLRHPPADPAARPPSPPPSIGPMVSRVEEADARALEALSRPHDAGIPMDEAVTLSARAGWGGRAAVDLARAADRVRRGEDLGGAWHLLPKDHALRLVAAEHAGELSSEAKSVAEDLRFRVEMRRKRTAALLPLGLMLAIGAVIAVRIFSFYSGIYSGLP